MSSDSNDNTTNTDVPAVATPPVKILYNAESGEQSTDHEPSLMEIAQKKFEQNKRVLNPVIPAPPSQKKMKKSNDSGSSDEDELSEEIMTLPITEPPPQFPYSGPTRDMKIEFEQSPSEFSLEYRTGVMTQDKLQETIEYFSELLTKSRSDKAVPIIFKKPALVNKLNALVNKPFSIVWPQIVDNSEISNYRA